MRLLEVVYSLIHLDETKFLFRNDVHFFLKEKKKNTTLSCRPLLGPCKLFKMSYSGLRDG